MDPSRSQSPEEPEHHGSTRRHPLTAAEKQRKQLELLLKRPEKPIVIPERPKEKTIKPPKDFVRNVPGSSAGAGSGEFHVYRANRRREFTRVKLMEEEAKKEKDQKEFQEKLERMQKEAEERTAKKRAKRQKRKAKQQNKKQKKENDATADGELRIEDEDGDEDEDGSGEDEMPKGDETGSVQEKKEDIKLNNNHEAA
ncbi:uncharacterized protein VTP21DRAFT_10021 [Calcarisporiella thermophila]|uniref:uncharacterized protein n=1 Tax=Calcarisporiella thermophila TaxID=911321 RepID=UPI0037436E6B